MPTPKAPARQRSLLDLHIGRLHLTPEAKAKIRSAATLAIQADNQRRALMGKVGPSPMGIALVASGLASPTAMASGATGRGQGQAPRAAPALRRAAHKPTLPAPLSTLADAYDKKAATVSDNIEYYGDRFGRWVDDRRKQIVHAPQVMRENLDYYAPGLKDYGDMVSRVDMTDAGMLTPEQWKLRRLAPSPPPPRYEERVDQRSVIKLARQAGLAEPRFGEDWVRGRGVLEGYYVPVSVARIADDPRKSAILQQTLQQELGRRTGVMADADRRYDREPPMQRNNAGRVRAAWNGALFNTFPYAEAAAEAVLEGRPFYDNLAQQKRFIERDEASDIPGLGLASFAGGLAEPSPFGKARKLKKWVVDPLWDGASGFASGYLASDADGPDGLGDGLESAARNVAFGRVADRLVTGAGRGFNDAIGYDPASAALQQQAAKLDGTTLNGLRLRQHTGPLGPDLPHLSGLAEAAAAQRRGDPAPWGAYAEIFREPAAGLPPHSLDELESGLTNPAALDQAIRGRYFEKLMDLDGDTGDFARDVIAEGLETRVEAEKRARTKRQTNPAR